MAEAVILLAVKKIGVAIGNEAIIQARSQFKKFIAQLTELQGSMGRIETELKLLHDYLCRMDVRDRTNQSYETWVHEVRRLGHGIEDIVDEYLHLIGQKHATGWSTYLKKGLKRPSVLFSLNRIASLVKEAEVNLVHLFEAKGRWVSMVGDGNISSSSYIVERSQHLASISRSLGEEDLVGVDENREKLVQWLAGDEDLVGVDEHSFFSFIFSFFSFLSFLFFCFLRRAFCVLFWPAVAGSKKLERSVIALHGMGGLGKTALAANIYRKERGKFECHAWVSISQTYSREDVLRNIIKELFKDKAGVPSDIETMDITCLEEKLKNFLERRKYLIILDDVWTPEAFDDFSRVLVCNNKGSRLVMTTREGDVATLASQGLILILESLPDADAWDLFCKKAFPRETNHECPAELKTLSEEIVSQCKGLPLAIVSVGSLLRVREKTGEEWKRINDQLSYELNHNPRFDHVRNVLHLSYIYLPTYLKSCFLYFSLFPEDYLFRRKILVPLWIAEGFIQERGESTLEEVAEGYLKELVNRNMLELVERNSFGRVKKFRMHDILRELAIDLCQKDCFGVIYEEDKYTEPLDVKDARRLVVHNLKNRVEQSISSIHRLRTFIMLDRGTPPSTLLTVIAEKCKYMSVLDLYGLPIEKIPEAVGDLFNLRYLSLRDSNVKLLPKSIEKLSNLLTLDLFASHIQELPGGIVKLKKLRHLFAEKWISPWQDSRFSFGVEIPTGLGNLINLQTLESLEVQDDSVKHLGELRQLRSLRIWNVKGIHCGHLSESLVQLPFLSNLSVGASDGNEVLRLNALPPNLQKLRLRGRLAEDTLKESPLLQAARRNLCLLHLYWSQLRDDPLPSLSQLSNLTDLLLRRAYDGEQLVFLMGWFPKLKTLELKDLPNLKRLKIEQGTMPSLEKLTLANLNSMVEVPPGIEFLMPLQSLGFYDITPDFLTLLNQCPRIGGMLWEHSLRD